MITFDWETRSYSNLPKVGAWAYAKHPTTEIICGCYGIDEAPTQEWWPGMNLQGTQIWPDFLRYSTLVCDMPYDLYSAVKEGHEVEGHGVAFERSIWEGIAVPDFGWLLPRDDQWRDTMAVAAYYSLPLGLDKLSKVLGFEGKDPEGGRLITKYSKLHLKTAQDEIPPDDFRKFVNYCRGDVEQEQKVSDFLGDLPEQELKVFLLDQEINRRGIYLDLDSIKDASVIVAERAKELSEEFKSITKLSPSQNDKARQWFNTNGCPVENLQADYIEEVLEGKQDFKVEGEVKRALEIRRKYNKASTKKLDAMKRQRDKKGRARFQVRYHGASTGRWTGTGIQPLNLTKSYEYVAPEQVIKDISYRDPRWLDIIYGDAMDAVSKASRHHIRAEEGYRIIAGDYVSIEAVLLSCLAGEDWKIEAFRNRDPIYELMGCEIHKLGPEAEALARKNKKAFKHQYPDERFDGKTGELAFGYQGGLGAWRNFDNSDKHTDERVNEIKDAWREKHPAIKQFWYDLEAAAVECVGRNVETEARDISFKRIDEWLAMRLPNGKRIWYWWPELRLTDPPWHDPEEWEDCAEGTCRCEPRNQLTYMAQKEGQWKRVSTYGGKLAENATQATSREILVPAMLGLRDAGYPIILSVYDEVVAEPKIGWGSVKEFAEIMLDVPRWAEEYPINVDVWEGDRYKK